MPSRSRIEKALAEADIRGDGARPHDIRVLDDRLWRRIAIRGLPGLCDAWVDGWWDCERPDEMFTRALSAGLADRLIWTWPNLLACARDRLFNAQTVRRARRHIRDHYDLGNDLFQSMLDRRMNYSCGYWQGATTLDEAQENKLELICRKLGLAAGARGVRLLDIGCGWGGLIGYAAERYGCECVGITLSEAQATYAAERYAHLPVEIRLQDYRHIPDRFDRIASVGMFEHVGARNHPAFMQAVQRALKPGGLALLHFFATQRGWPTIHRPEAVWVERNIFPGMATPSLAQVGRALARATEVAGGELAQLATAPDKNLPPIPPSRDLGASYQRSPQPPTPDGLRTESTEVARGRFGAGGLHGGPTTNELPPRDLGGTRNTAELIVEDLHNFGADYDPTLMGWHANFMRAWPDLQPRYGDRFGRMWEIYLLLCAAAFRSRRYQLWQFVLSRGVPGGYQRPGLTGAAPAISSASAG